MRIKVNAYSNSHNVSRRNFLKQSAAVPISAGILAANSKEAHSAPSPLNLWPGKYVRNYNHDASTGSNADQAVVAKMVDDSIKALTGESTVGAAWRSVFPPSFSLSSRVAIKINILNNTVPSHPYVVKGITEGLQQIDIGGSNFPASNIYIYDNFNSNSMDSAGFTSTLFPGITRIKDSISNHGDGARGASYSNTLHTCDFLINVPVLKGQSSDVEYFTITFKNHYGTYSPAYHNSNARPYLRDINCTGPVYNKTVLVVVSAIFAKKEGNGPSGPPESYLNYAKTLYAPATNPAANTIIMSTDPVTAEFQAIKTARLQDGNDYSIPSLPNYLKSSGGVTGALSPTYNIGIIDETLQEAIIITNGTTIQEPVNKKEGVPAIAVSPNPGNPNVKISLNNLKRNIKRATLEIFDINGRAVTKETVAVINGRLNYFWSSRRYGRANATGVFKACIKVGSKVYRGSFIVVK